MRKKNTLLMSVTLLILALFIGTAITPATAGLPASMPNNEKAEVAVEETVAEPVESQEECSLCADQEASSENEEESTVGPDETLPMEGEPVGSKPMGSEPMESETTQEELLGGEATEGGSRSL